MLQTCDLTAAHTAAQLSQSPPQMGVLNWFVASSEKRHDSSGVRGAGGGVYGGRWIWWGKGTSVSCPHGLSLLSRGGYRGVANNLITSSNTNAHMQWKEDRGR